MTATFFVTLSPLIERCQAGDQRALEELTSTHWVAVHRLALSILDDAAEADEAAQDAFIRALNALPTFRGDSAFTTWLYSIALNVCRSRLRQRRSRERLQQMLVFMGAGAASAHVEEQALQNTTERAVSRAIQSLADPLREAIILRYYHDLPIADIARVAGVSERTIHTRLHTANDRLKALLHREVSLT